MHETSLKVYLFVRSFMSTNDGRPPTIRDIAEGIRPEQPMSSSVVCHHLNCLEASGLIKRVRIRDTRKRVIQLPGAYYLAPPMPEIGR